MNSMIAPPSDSKTAPRCPVCGSEATDAGAPRDVAPHIAAVSYLCRSRVPHLYEIRWAVVG